MIVEAIGQFPDLDFVEDTQSPIIQTTRWHTIEANEDTLQTDVPYVFTGGDCFTGPALLVDAVAAGRYAARSIHFYMMEDEIPPIRDRQRDMISECMLESILDVTSKPRVHEPVIPLEERLGTFHEVEVTIDEESARYEAERCLNCGIHCYNHETEMEKLAEAKEADEKTAAAQ